MYIDSHTHLYLEQFDLDRADVVAEAVASGVTKMCLPNIDSSTIQAMYQMEVDFPSECYAMMGLHPCSVKENYLEELAIVEKELRSRAFIAVGEIGLDFYWDVTYKEQQIAALEKQIIWAKEFQIPVVLHTRDSFEEALAIIQKHKDDRLRGVFHCFGGSTAQAEAVFELDGFYIGIGGVATFKKSGLDKVISEIELDKVILETDSPYLAPTPHRGKRNESSYIPLIAAKIAEVKGMKLEEVAEITSQNTAELFKI